MAADLILKNTRAVLEITVSAGDADGAGTVTVTTTRADGTAGPSGTATNEAEPGRYTFALVPQSELDLLTVTWSGTWGASSQSLQTFAEIVGGNLFSLADLRAFGDRALANTASYPDADLRAARTRVTDLFADVCETSFIPRYGRDTLDGSGSLDLFLTRKRVSRLISITVAGVAYSAPDLALVSVYPSGRLSKTGYWTTGLRNTVVAYEHGWPHVPADISRAAMTLARYELVESNISDRMLSFDNDLGTVRLSVPGRNFPTGIPVVDATLARYDETMPVGP
jgi:hypothetical protein